jgi:hypothetical protein|tara:strand:+ start:171 stop:488 length:318 start_codon:yes stop_codon:yes gene_type:complete
MTEETLWRLRDGSKISIEVMTGDHIENARKSVVRAVLREEKKLERFDANLGKAYQLPEGEEKTGAIEHWKAKVEKSRQDLAVKRDFRDLWEPIFTVEATRRIDCD